MPSVSTITEEQSIKVLQNSLPDGKLYNKKWEETSNIYKLLLGYAQGIQLSYNDFIDNVLKWNIDAATGNELLAWEKSVGLPDGCFLRDTLARRRAAVKIKFSKKRIVTAADIDEVFSEMNIDAAVDPTFIGSHFVYTFAILFTVGAGSIIKVIYNTFPVIQAEIDFITCFLEEILPANTTFIIETQEA